MFEPQMSKEDMMYVVGAMVTSSCLIDMTPEEIEATTKIAKELAEKEEWQIDERFVINMDTGAKHLIDKINAGDRQLFIEMTGYNMGHFMHNMSKEKWDTFIEMSKSMVTDITPDMRFLAMNDEFLLKPEIEIK
jgi:hypothetical protein